MRDDENYYVCHSSVVPKDKQKMFRQVADAVQREHQYGFREFPEVYTQEQYPYIPYLLDYFEHSLKPLLRNRMRVIDVGCGGGDKLMSLHLLNPTLRITGIEYNPTVAAFASYVCAKFATVICGDALEHNYKPYDLIYMYRPLVHEDAQSALQEQVMRTMRVGASLVVKFQARINTRTSTLFPQLDVWEKKSAYRPDKWEKCSEHDLRYIR